MDTPDLEHLRYPVGRFRYEGPYTPEKRSELIQVLRSLPADLTRICQELEAEDLSKRYRPGGWTLRQVVHHLADSHVNAYQRFKLALTEEKPSIKTYEEALWAELPDCDSTPIEISVTLLSGLHVRWTNLLEALQDSDFQRSIIHPERQREMSLDFLLGMYAWHSQHHLGHIRLAMDNGFED